MPRKDIQSVTNAILDQKLITLADEVHKLTETVGKGFEGVHQRQDTTNGKVLQAKDDIVALKAKFEYNRIIWYMLTTAVSVIIALGSYIIFK